FAARRANDWVVPATSTAAAVRPPLKWAGGKRWLVRHLLPYWSHFSDRRLVEPFCGGLAVTLGLAPERALLNDRNPHLIHFYSWLKRELHIRIQMENDERLFYAHRGRFNDLLGRGEAESADAAALFYYLNRTGFNGLCRFNSRGEFNVPFGRYKRIGYVSDFTAYSETFRAWKFTTGDLESVAVQPGDFIYADPPYDVEFTHYSQGGFSWHDQQRTAEWLTKHDGPVILV